MKGIWRKLLSLFLALILTLQLLPVQALAAGVNSIPGEKAGLALVDSRLTESESAEGTEIANPPEAEEPQIVAEIPEGRDKFQKEFRLSNGMNMISIYGSAVHYEDNGEWKEIDNTLQPVSATGEVLSGKFALTSPAAYTNTAGMWDVKLPASLDTGKTVEVSRDGYTLSFQFAGEIHNNHEVMSLEEELATAAFDETESLAINGQDLTVNADASVTQISTSSATVLDLTASVADSPQQSQSDKLYSALQYSDIYANTDLRYDLQSNQLKESIIIKSAKDTLAGYKYVLSAPNMVLELQDDNSIHAYAANAAEGDEPLFYMPAPFLVDDNRLYNDDITVNLQRSGDTYTLTYSLPRAWLLDDERAYPVVLDPVIRPESGIYTISDQTVWSDATTSFTWGCVAVGYTPSQGKARTLIKFRYLPELSSADVIVGANLSLRLVEYDSAVTMEAHQVLTEWESDTVTWSDVDNNVNDPTAEWNTEVEDYQIITNPTWYTWDITNIAQGWYADGYNSGVFFKASDEYEDINTHETREFYSSDWGGWVTPILQIMYLNNSGLEDIWDYTSQSAGRAGTGHVNNFTGNLVWVHNGLSFSGNRMPVSISHIYNANDKDHKGHNNNDYGMGYGWRTNYNQHVYSWTSPGDNPTTYYVWVDQDGTRRYFNYSSSGTYKNEIDNTLVLTTTGSGDEKYCITDKDGNKSYFDTSGRLKKILNNQETPSIITITYTSSSSKLIASITDGSGETNTDSRTATGGRKYIFTYTDGNLSRIAFQGTGNTDLSYLTYEYDNSDNLTKITYLDGEFISYYYGDDPGKHLLYRATDVSGYSVHYSYTEHSPYRVASITESDVDEVGDIVSGGSLAIQYAHNETTFTDHNGNKEIVQFNKYGSTVSIQDGLGRAQFAQYGEKDNPMSASQLTLSSKLQSTAINLLADTDIEWIDTEYSDNSCYYLDEYEPYFAYPTVAFQSRRSGFFAVEVDQPENLPVLPGRTYVFSCYMITESEYAFAHLEIGDGSVEIPHTQTSVGTSGWVKIYASYTHPEDAPPTTANVVLAQDGRDTTIFSDLQLVESPSPVRYNLVTNSDFRNGTSGWSKNSSCTSHDTAIDGTTPPDLLISAAPQLDTSAFKIIGKATSSKTVSQTISLSGNEGDVFTLAGWGKGGSVPLVDARDPNEKGRKFGLSVTFIGSGGEGEEHIVSFNPDSDSENNWQYAATRVVADKDYTSVRVSLLYCKNMNTAYFDGIQLYKEEFGQSYVYDDETGLVTSVIDLHQKETTYEYESNQLTAIIENGTKTIAKYEYDSYNNVTKATAEDGTTTYFAYDAYGNNTAVAVSDDPELTFNTDEETGKPCSVSVGSENVALTSFAEYTPDGNYLETVTDTLGNVTSYGYNAQTGMLDWVQAPGETESTRTKYTYDNLYRTTELEKTDASITYNYTTNLLNTIQSASGTIYDFDYGVFDLLQSVKVGTRTLISHSYDSTTPNFYLDKSTYGNQDYIEYEYDQWGRLVTKTFGDENGTDSMVTYRYDNNGNLGLMTDSATGRTTTYFYDFQDRLSRYEETGSGYSSTVEWTYNTDNNLSSQTHVLNGTTYTTEYAYDDETKRLTNSSQGGVLSEYEYDSLGRMENIIGSNNGTQTVKSSIGYVGSTTATSSQVASWYNYLGTVADPISAYNYTYDARGNITQISLGEKTEGQEPTPLVSYEYDDFDQLTLEKNYVAGKSWAYTYDPGGNIITKTQYDSTSNVTSGGTCIQYKYEDSKGWEDLLTKHNGVVLDYDEIGNLVNDGNWDYIWTHGRQLVEMEKPDKTSAISFAYNADGLRISKDVDGTVYNYHYLGDQLVEMTWGSNKMAFIYDDIGPAALIYNGTTYYYTRNVQGDVTGIVGLNNVNDGNNPNTEANYSQVVSYTYDAWGKVLLVEDDTTCNLGTLNPLRYRGYVYDYETSLYYLQSRYYNPDLGRFINADIFVSTGQSFAGDNMFVYCNNNPVSYRDAKGSFSVWIIGEFAVQAVFGAICSYSSAAMVAGITGEDLNQAEAILWALGDGILYGFASVCSPFNLQRVRFFQFFAVFVKCMLNGDDCREILFSLGWSFLPGDFSTGDEILDAVLDIILDVFEGIIQNVDDIAKNLTDSTAPSPQNDGLSSPSPGDEISNYKKSNCGKSFTKKQRRGNIIPLLM